MSGQGTPHRCQGKEETLGQGRRQRHVRGEEVSWGEVSGDLVFLLELEVGSCGLGWARPARRWGLVLGRSQG